MRFQSRYVKTLSDRFWLALGGASKGRTRQEIENSLHYAALTNKLWRADFLIRERQADVGSSENFALRWASAGGHLDMMRLLLAHGADVNAKEGEALCRAVAKGHEEAALFLLGAGADPVLAGGKALRAAHAQKALPVLKEMLTKGKFLPEDVRVLLDDARQNQERGLVSLYEDYLTPPPAGHLPPRMN